MEDLKCGFCHLGTEVKSICGKLHYDDKKLAAHHKCMQYSANLGQWTDKFQFFGGFDPNKVKNEISRGKRLKCFICKNDKSRREKWMGATSGCAIPSCSKTFHYYCAKLDDGTLAKRMEVKYLQKMIHIVMHCVFCSEAHYEQFKENKAFLKNQHQNLRNKNFFGEETEGNAKVQADEISSNSQNTQMEGDILCRSQLSPSHNLINGECSTSEKDENSGKISANKSKTKEVKESVTCSLVNPFLTEENETNEIKESAKCSPEAMCPTEANKPDESPAMVFPANAKHDVPKEKEKECLEISDEECGFQSLSDSSDSELENPFSKNPENTNVEVDRHTGTFNHSKDQNQGIKIDETKEVKESVTCSLINPFPTEANKTNEIQESVECSPKTMCPTEANKADESPALVFPANAKHDVPKEKEKECLEISDEDYGFQSLSDSSDSELENPFIMKPENRNVEVDKQSFDNSKDQTREMNSDDSKRITVKYVEKSNNGSKEIESEETIECRRKAKQEAASQQKFPVSREKAVSESKNTGTNKTTEGGLGYNTAELHVATSPLPVDEAIIEEDDSSSGQWNISDDEVTMETDGSTTGSVLQQKSSPPSPNRLPEMSSESEWEEMSQFPVCAVAISSTTKVWSSKRNMIIQRAKEGFGVNYVVIWTTTDFSDQFTDEYLPHLMRIITEMVRERRFNKLGSLLTDTNYQLTQMDSIKHMVDLPDEVVENIRKSLIKKLDREEINGEEVLFMDTKLNTLFLKLNDTVDRVCKIRSILFPHAKEFRGHLFEWKESTASSAPLRQSDTEMEWKAINNWMTHQQWNLSESFIYPSDDIFLAANKNQGIEELMMHQTPRGANKRKVIFVRAMKEVVNYNTFIQELILSCVETDDTLIICHSVPVITRQSLVPVDLPKETQVQVMSAFKPSNKRGISILVIHICNQKQQRLTTDPSQVNAEPCEDEITLCLEDVNPKSDRKRKAITEEARTSAQKRKRAA